jgi:seryl-tRNA synthetase
VRAQRAAIPAAASSEDRVQILTAEKKSADELLAAQTARLAQLQEQSSREERELSKLRAALREIEEHSKELAAANSQSGGKLQEFSQQRDTLNTQLQDANLAYQSVRTELTSLRAERDRVMIRTSSLEARIEELTAVNRDQERRLKDTEQYLASDRDIRELMGARKLYIADVFDVDSGSRTKKPFGRVFYTQGKSLIFYAFDLDRQRGLVNASTFQVWGQKEMAQGEQALPLNLGILYMDNETNRRWVMRFDDPKQLAEIDAVFVTVEPRGGSQKPTSKPFLYALLRNDANHP